MPEPFDIVPNSIVFDGQECREVIGCHDIWVPITGDFIVSTRIKHKGHDGSPHKLSLHLDKDGYSRSGVKIDGTGASLSLHQAVALAWKGPAIGLVVRHLDDNRRNNHASNLEWGTHAENGMDKRKFGTAKGLRNSQAKMNEETVMRLRSDALIKSLTVLVRETPQFSKFAIWAAITGYTWSHLPGAKPSDRRCTKQGWKDGVRLKHETD